MMNNASNLILTGSRIKSKYEFVIDDEGIISFNENLGNVGVWGTFDRPFVSNHFMTVRSNHKEFNVDTIIDFQASSEISMDVISKSDNSPYQLEIDYLKLNIIGSNDFQRISPRQAWGQILDLKETDGAIGVDGSFYLGESRNTGEFTAITSDRLNKFSYNLEYQVGFTILVHGQLNRYCVVDPLIKTSSVGHD